MPELPEITVIARQMNREIAGKRIAQVEVRQPKILNVTPRKLAEAIRGKVIDSASSRGKWIFVRLRSGDYLLLNLGMGAELVRFDTKRDLPQKHQFMIAFADGTGFTAHFWWFGYVHLVKAGDLNKHKPTSSLGVSPFDLGFTEARLKDMLSGRKVGIKSFLIDQKNIAGIGNVYVQDILFRARLHPSRRTSTLTGDEVHRLYKAILKTLGWSVKLGGLAYERDFYGHMGGFTSKEFLVGYKEGRSCPICGTIIRKIRTGSTATYICPKCQML